MALTRHTSAPEEPAPPAHRLGRRWVGYAAAGLVAAWVVPVATQAGGVSWLLPVVIWGVTASLLRTQLAEIEQPTRALVTVLGLGALVVLGEATGAAAAYVGMTRGRHHNTAHLVAESIQEARAQWVDVFSRDRADVGPGHAAQTAAEDIERYGLQAHPRGSELDVHTPHQAPRRPPQPIPAPPAPPGSTTVRR